MPLTCTNVPLINRVQGTVLNGRRRSNLGNYTRKKSTRFKAVPNSVVKFQYNVHVYSVVRPAVSLSSLSCLYKIHAPYSYDTVRVSLGL